MSVVALLPTTLAALGAGAAIMTSGTEADLYWFFTGVVALVAAAVWLVAIILLRPSGWGVPAFATLLAVLVAAGIYGGVRDGEEGIPLVVASVVVLLGCIATLLWSRGSARQR